MWRSTTRSFSSKLLFPSNPPHRFNGGILFQSQIHSSGAGVSSSVDSFKLGFKKPNSGASLRFTSSDAILYSSTSVSLSQHVSEAIRHYSRCYWELSKARLSMLVVATSGAGFVLGSGGLIDFAGLCWTCGGTMMVAASANSLNQVFEVKNDAKMKRTRLRPLPSGRISVPHAAIWASTVGIAGTTILADKANFLTAGLAASTLALYAFVYTPLKQIHPVNTWVGAVVGAIPPLLGWAAASGDVSLNGMILPAALYFWQLPHFMALAYLCRNDYVDGGFRMFSLADASGRRTSLVALRNCIYLLPLGFFAYDWGLTSEWFFAESTLLTLAMGAGALSFCLDRTSKNARRMFHASLLYLPVFMAGMLIHRLPNGNPQELPATDSNKLLKLPLSDSQIDGFEDDNLHIEPRKSIRTRARPPVSYASVAPFPFLPVPVYASNT